MTSTETQVLPTGWRGRLLPVNTVSGDGPGRSRLFALDGDVVPSRPLPVAFNGQELLGEGHDGSRVVGLITRVWLENGFVMGEGPFDLADPFAAEWARKLGDGFAGWVSIDLSDGRVEEVPLDAAGNPIPDEVFQAWNAEMIAWQEDGEQGPPPEPPVVADVLIRISDWKVAGATLVSVPAFEDARVQPVWDEFASTPAAPALTAAAEDGEQAPVEHTGAMIALVPTDPGVLAVEGGDPAEELHMTLAYLGEAADWSPDAQAALTTALGSVLGGGASGKVFGHAVFNPDDAEKEACAVYIVDSPDGRMLRDAVLDVLATTTGLPALVDQHEFVPHITAGYGVDMSTLVYTGDVSFDRLRVAFAGQATDLLLDTEALAASAGVLYRHEDFFAPEPEHYVDSWQVEPDGRVSMHLARWGECHIGFSGTCITPPPGVAEYARFHRVPVDTDQGTLRVGKVTMGTGHASTDPHLSASAVMSHYDNTGTLVAVVRCRDGALGPWLSGRLVPWATTAQAQQLRYHEVSGDWRGRPGQLELVAALAVNVPGFMRSVAASGAQVLIAAGRPHHRVRPGVRASAPVLSREELRAEVRTVLAEISSERAHAAAVAPLDAKVRRARLDRLDRRVWGTA